MDKVQCEDIGYLNPCKSLSEPLPRTVPIPGQSMANQATKHEDDRGEQRYGGRLVYSGQEGNTRLEIVDRGRMRSLHFGNSARQSTMDLDAPHRLVLPYTRAMMSALLLRPNPRRILVLGLGGGSFVRFFARHFPACEIDVVEHSRAVTDLAYEYFQLPKTHRLAIHQADAGNFVVDANVSRYDLIMLDAFTARGTPDRLQRTGFFRACEGRLRTAGVLAANLWRGAPVHPAKVIGAMREAFAGSVLQLPVRGGGNLAVFALKVRVRRRDLRALRPRAATFDRQYDLDLSMDIRRAHDSGGFFAWLSR